MTTVNKDFMPPRGDYHKLIVYRKAECIYDITYHFAHTYLERGDRTIDQMVQAAQRQAEHSRGKPGGDGIEGDGTEALQRGKGQPARAVGRL